MIYSYGGSGAIKMWMPPSLTNLGYDSSVYSYFLSEYKYKLTFRDFREHM
jgi:hypothetical protein